MLKRRAIIKFLPLLGGILILTSLSGCITYPKIYIHMPIKGQLVDKKTGKGIANALVIAQSRENTSGRFGLFEGAEETKITGRSYCFSDAKGYFKTPWIFRIGLTTHWFILQKTDSYYRVTDAFNAHYRLDKNTISVNQEYPMIENHFNYQKFRAIIKANYTFRKEDKKQLLKLFDKSYILSIEENFRTGETHEEMLELRKKLKPD